MAKILSISYDYRLLRTRELLLQRMGHSVMSAEGFAQAVRSCDQGTGTFDLVVLGHSIPHEDKRTIIRHCNHKPPIAFFCCPHQDTGDQRTWMNRSGFSRSKKS